LRPQQKFIIRKNILIQRGLQFKYLIILLGTIVIVTALIILTVYFAYWSLSNDMLIEQQTGRALSYFFSNIKMLLIFELPIILIVAGFISIVLSHRIAGPIYHVQKVARKIARGDLTTNVHLRRDDELKNLSAAFNSVIDNMHLLVTKDKKLIYELSQLTDTLYLNLKDRKINEEEALAMIRKLNNLVGELKALILQYKIKEDKQHGNS